MISTPLYSSLNLPPLDSFWFNVDATIDDESELVTLEKEHQSWLDEIAMRDSDIPGLTEEYDEGDDEGDESDGEPEEDDSDTNEEEDDEEGEEIEIGV